MRNPQGFTLVELLVSLALLSIVLGILLTTQSTVIGSSMTQQTNAVRLGVITDISGYVADRIKAAALLPDGVTLNGASCQRSPTSGLPCLAAVVPQVDATGQINTWELHAFQYVDPAGLAVLERTPGLTGVNVALRELVLVSTCAQTVPTSATLATCFSGIPSTSLLSDELALPASGTAAFEYDSAQRLVMLRLRSVSLQNGAPAYLPANGSYALKVYARNVP